MSTVTEQPIRGAHIPSDCGCRTQTITTVNIGADVHRSTSSFYDSYSRFANMPTSFIALSYQAVYCKENRPR